MQIIWTNQTILIYLVVQNCFIPKESSAIDMNFIYTWHDIENENAIVKYVRNLKVVEVVAVVPGNCAHNVVHVGSNHELGPIAIGIFA